MDTPTPTTRRARIYVSGPLTTGMLTANVRAAAEIASDLLALGYAVYLPHTNVLWEIIRPATYDAWLEHDFEWIRTCDAVLRIPGQSHGGDAEVKWAAELKIPVYFSIDEILQYVEKTREAA